MAALGQQGITLFNDLLRVLRDSLDAAISHVFLYGLVIIIIAFVVNLFIKEIPLRTRHTLDVKKQSEPDKLPD